MYFLILKLKGKFEHTKGGKTEVPEQTATAGDNSYSEEQDVRQHFLFLPFFVLYEFSC